MPAEESMSKCHLQQRELGKYHKHENRSVTMGQWGMGATGASSVVFPRMFDVLYSQLLVNECLPVDSVAGNGS